jgi:hypothetical protein
MMIATKDDDADACHDNSAVYVAAPRCWLSHVRSALTMVTPPSYLKDTLYAFDVVDVKIESEHKE